MGSLQSRRIAPSQSRFPFSSDEIALFSFPLEKCGVLAQLVERLNGIEEVRGSNPLGSISLILKSLQQRANRASPRMCEGMS